MTILHGLLLCRAICGAKAHVKHEALRGPAGRIADGRDGREQLPLGLRPGPMEANRSPTARESPGSRSGPWFVARRSSCEALRCEPSTPPGSPTIRERRTCPARTSPETGRCRRRRYAPHIRCIPFPPAHWRRWPGRLTESPRGGPDMAVMTATTRIMCHSRLFASGFPTGRAQLTLPAFLSPAKTAARPSLRGRAPAPYRSAAFPLSAARPIHWTR